MKKLLFCITLCSLQYSLYCTTPNMCPYSSSQNNQTPVVTFEQPIHLFDERKLANRFQEILSTIPATVIAWLQNSESYKILEKGIGRQLTQTGHDESRKEIYTGVLLQPEFIVLTTSGQPTLSETVNALKKEGLAHNFIIDTNGKIYPITKEGETLQNALKHRPYSLGISGRVIDGYREQRDMNSASITISIVGIKDMQPTPEQNQAILKLTEYLSTEYNISRNQVLDYGCVACHADGSYGRRNTNPNLPWEKIAIYPQDNHIKLTQSNFDNQRTQTIWTALALRKIGYICPITSNPSDEHFKKALIAFQNHTKADNKKGIITPDTIGRLNSMIIQHEFHNPNLKDIQPPALPLKT